MITSNDVDEMYESNGTRSVIGGMDLDQAGSREMIMTDYNGHRVILFEYNIDANAFEEVWASPVIDNVNSSVTPRTVGTGDLDGDGKHEIAFPLSASGNEGWYIYE